MGQDFTTILTGIGTIVLMFAVFVGAYYFSKFVSKKTQPNKKSVNPRLGIFLCFFCFTK